VALSFVTIGAVSISGAAEVRTIAGNGRPSPAGDGGPALAAAIGGPFGLTLGPDKALYVCETENHRIRRIDLAAGTISTVAGSGKKGYAGDGGPAVRALCSEPYEVRFDRDGHMYFVEMRGNVVRRVDAKTGTISTIAGTGRAGFGGDKGPAVAAQLNSPHSIALDAADNLYIADIGNHRVRVVDLKTGTIRTLSGTGERQPTPDGATLAGTPLNGPRALDGDGADGLFLALREGNAVYRIDLSTQTLKHLAGTGKSGYAGDGGPAAQALLSGPKGIALGPQGDLYLADTESHTIRIIRQRTGRIETLVGDGQAGDGPDGDPLHCRLNRPHGIFVDPAGTVYIGDSSNNRVRVLSASP
jgi:DNA-binding beta-propeller fold protein YncE